MYQRNNLPFFSGHATDSSVYLSNWIINYALKLLNPTFTLFPHVIQKMWAIKSSLTFIEHEKHSSNRIFFIRKSFFHFTQSPLVNPPLQTSQYHA